MPAINHVTQLPVHQQKPKLRQNRSIDPRTEIWSISSGRFLGFLSVLRHAIDRSIETRTNDRTLSERSDNEFPYSHQQAHSAKPVAQWQMDTFCRRL